MIILETTGDFGLVDPSNGAYIQPFRPTVAKVTAFIQQRIATNQIRVLSDPLPDDANDADFAKFLQDSDGKVDLAVAAYISSFDAPEKKGRGKPKPATVTEA